MSEWIDRPDEEGFWWIAEKQRSGISRLRACEARIRSWDDREKTLVIEAGSVWVRCDKINSSNICPFENAKFMKIETPQPP